MSSTSAAAAAYRLKVLEWRKLHDCMCMLDEHSSSTNVVVIRINVSRQKWVLLHDIPICYDVGHLKSCHGRVKSYECSRFANPVLPFNDANVQSFMDDFIKPHKDETEAAAEGPARGAGWPSTERGRRPGHGDVTGDCRKTVRVLSGYQWLMDASRDRIGARPRLSTAGGSNGRGEIVRWFSSCGRCLCYRLISHPRIRR